MRLSSLAVAVIFLFSSTALAQHSSANAGASSSSSSAGGGSHSSSSGGYSGGSSHSAGGSSSGVSHTSSSGGSSHSSSSGGSSHSTPSGGGHSGSSTHNGGGSNGHVINPPGNGSQPSHLSAPHSNAMYAEGVRSDNARPTHEFRSPIEGAAPQKRSFFSFLRHPFPRPKPQPAPTPVPQAVRRPVANLRHPVCLRGPCLACPAGQVSGPHGCVNAIISHGDHFCSSSEIWSGGACVQQLRFLDNCSWSRMAMARQQQAMRAAAAEMQRACAASQSQECSEATTRLDNEESLYRSFRNRYLRCENNQLVYPWAGSFYPRTGFGLIFDPFGDDRTFWDTMEFQF